MYHAPSKLKAIDSIEPCYLFDVFEERNKHRLYEIPTFVEQSDLTERQMKFNTRKLGIYAHYHQYHVMLNLTQAFPRRCVDRPIRSSRTTQKRYCMFNWIGNRL